MPTTLQQITVTAQKTAERAIDVPMGMSVLTAEDLQDQESWRFEDWPNHVAGLTLIQSSPLFNYPVIRGITMGVGSINSSTAVYLDETPITSEGSFANSGIAPNFDTYDLSRIEVLKGPQGTLYGANALGGIIKYVTHAPDPSGFAASAQEGFSSVTSGADGYDTHGMLNLPLSGDAALRLVAYDTYYGGYIDDVNRDRDDVNGEHVSGGRAQILWAPSDALSIRVTGLFQRTSLGDQAWELLKPGDVPLYGPFEESKATSSPQSDQNEILNATIRWRLTAVNLVSSTSYSRTPLSQVTDATAAYGGYLPPYGGAAIYDRLPVSNLTQELRLASNPGTRLTWQAGGYFNHEYAPYEEQLLPVDLSTQAVIYNDPVNFLTGQFESTYIERAGFANLDFFILPNLDVAAGARYSTNDQTFTQITSGTFVRPTDFLVPSRDHVTTWSADLRWHLAPTLMSYFRAATGYAPGGANDALPGTPVAPEYGSSTTLNYEVGVKGEALQGRLTYDADLYHILWRDIQISTVFEQFTQITNGGAAASDGAE